MERLLTRLGFAMIIIGLLGLSQTAFAKGTDKEYNDLYDAVSNYVPIYSEDLSADGFWGYYQYADEYIVIHNDLNDEDWWHTFLHETIHVIQDCKNITEGLPIFDTNLFQQRAQDSDQEEYSDVAWFALGYPVDQYDVEFEAEYIARYSSISYIQSLFDINCKG